MTIKVVSLPTTAESHKVKERLQAAIDYEFDEVFIIGFKEGIITVSISGYNGIERRLGALELLKQDMIKESQE